MSFNSLTIGSRICKDAELRYTPKALPVLNFSLPVDIGWGESKQVQWVDCSYFGERAEKLAQFMVKGTSVVVMGKLQTLNHFTRKDGTAGASLRMTVNEVTFMSPKTESREEEGPEADDY